MISDIKAKFSKCFSLLCGILFTYKAFECTDAYSNQQPTRSFHDKHNMFPFSSICIKPEMISNDKLNLHNLTFNGYTKEGKWKSNFSTFDEERPYDDLSALFEDLVEKIKIKKELMMILMHMN